MTTIAVLRKRRGVPRASITRLGRRLEELEGLTNQPDTLNIAQQLKKKLSELDAEFKKHHYNLVDVVDGRSC